MNGFLNGLNDFGKSWKMSAFNTFMFGLSCILDLAALLNGKDAPVLWLNLFLAHSILTVLFFFFTIERYNKTNPNEASSSSSSSR